MRDKQAIREQMWQEMTEKKIGRFPFPLKGRIPNFKGAEQATRHLIQLEVYKQAKVVKVNPDSPQLPLRAQVLMDRKTLLVPTPRLKDGFILVKPEWVPEGEERKAVSLRNILSYGKVISLTEMPEIDLIVMGSVAVDRSGRRIGKGEGYADREYAIIRELGNRPVPVVTTVHQVQLLDVELPRDAYDVTVDWIATTEGLMQSVGAIEKPTGIVWSEVTEEELEAMPVLREIRELTKKQ